MRERFSPRRRDTLQPPGRIHASLHDACRIQQRQVEKHIMKRLRKPIEFERFSKDYAGLCKVLMPRPIHDQVELENVVEIADAMAGQTLTADQNDYFDLLCRLIENYEEERLAAPKVSGLEALRHLVKEHGMSGAHLSRLLGSHRTLGTMILRGERKLTVEHIKKLSSHFSVSAELFLAP
jgi:HTH-type transcriptional regulator / antitoxin HigA